MHQGQTGRLLGTCSRPGISVSSSHAAKVSTKTSSSYETVASSLLYYMKGLLCDVFVQFPLSKCSIWFEYLGLYHETGDHNPNLLVQ